MVVNETVYKPSHHVVDRSRPRFESWIIAPWKRADLHQPVHKKGLDGIDDELLLLS